VLGAVALVFVASFAPVPPAIAQQYFNGAQTTPNGAVNGGSGVWDNATTNWTNATGTVSNTYDPTISAVTVFGASGSSTPATGGTVTVTPGGIQLTGNVQFTGTGNTSPYVIQGGSLALAAGGTTFNVSTGNFFTPAAVVSSSIVGNDGVTVTGSGLLTFAGTNSYAGGTLVSGDPANGVVLQVTNNNAVGPGTVTLQNGIFQADGFSNLTFTNNFMVNSSALGGGIDANGKTLKIAGTIAGAGKLSIFDSSFGGGVVVLTGANTYSGGTFICGCATLQLGDPGHTGSIIGDIVNEGQFGIFNANTSNITSITNQTGGQTIFLNGTTAGTMMIVNNGGATFFTNTSDAGNATIITNSGGGVVFSNRSNGGNAQFITNGTGFVNFSGSSGPGGLGTITAGSIAGSGRYNIGGIRLVVGGNNLSTEVSGVITDGCGCFAGLLTKVGSGTLTLSGTHNSYTGPTNVDGGTLLVTGSIASSAAVVVGNGATLGGTGIVPMTFLNPAGAILAPGLPNALGTLTVNDELTFFKGAFYDVNVTSAGSDLTQVVPNLGTTTAVSLAGTVQVTSLNASYKFNSPYTILNAQNGFGGTQFNSLVTPGGINGLLIYTATEVDLTLKSALGQLPGANVNQRNVGAALDNVFNSIGNSGGLGAIFGSNVLQNLTQVSGELATGVQSATYNAMNLFISSLTDPFIDGRGGGPGAGGAQGFSEDERASAYAARQSGTARDAFAKIPTKAIARNDLLDNRWSVWGTAFGGSANIHGDAALGSNNADVRAFGLAAGFDYRISSQTIAGFALAGGGTNFGVSGFGSGRSDMFQAGAYVRHTAGAAYVTGALAYGGQEVTTDRIVTVAGFDHLQARFDTHAVTGRLEGGYRFVTPWMGVTPYAAGQFTTIDLPAYAEQVLAGTGNFALNYAAKTATDARTELGVRTDRSYAMNTGVLTLRGRLAWAHDFTTDRNVAAVFPSLPGAFFVVNGAAQAPDSALATVSAEMRWMNHWSAAATFEGEFSPVMNSYAGKGVVRYTW
jgi:autotransporter-associated beta strand protein